jgi:SAM-dependent methyltransferase
MKSSYNRDPATGIWSSARINQFNYSDGDETEAELMKIVSEAADVSTVSAELAGAIVDWPTEYHLSAARHNLLRPFNIRPSDSVLELGCGCGALTRYFGETGAAVVAVEGSMRRAGIAAARCRGLSNVSIYCDNLITFASDDKFDFVTLIGVLEYAPRFIEGSDPITKVLSHARSFLKQGGTLILAIENQLGLKYFNGCSEDHLGIPYYGINDLYRDHEPITFGRQALSNCLHKADFSEQTFFYPFPDYKLPSVILSGDALADERLNIPDLLIHQSGRTHPETWQRAFAEDLAWRVAIRNRMLPDLANSFFVLARASGSVPRQVGWLAKIYSRGRRRASYQIETTIAPDATNCLRVIKRKVFPTALLPQAPSFRQVVDDAEYVVGTLLIGKIHRAMAREAGIDELAACFTPWLNFLLSHVTTNNKGDRLLPPDFVDCSPANLIEAHDGTTRYFDAEWVSNAPIPLAWTVVRGIVYSLIDCLENVSLQGMTYRQFVTAITARNGVELASGDLCLADDCESHLVAQCHTNHAATPRLFELLDTPLFLTARLAQRSTDYRQSLAWHQAELARVKRTVSWRITAPMRASWNLLLRLTRKRPE